MPHRANVDRTPPLGLIEGFFGRPWSWPARRAAADFLGQAGFDFYLYAPKADAFLRRQWREHWPGDQWRELLALREQCREAGVAFGVGLSPLELYRESPARARAQLAEKVRRLNALKPDILGLLFDDMRGDLPELAERQSELAHVAAETSLAGRVILCPTYYSFDPVLEKVFGERPAGYWQQLGQELDPAIDLFWTGPEVCSTHYPDEHLAQVSDWLGRRPFLWDNYPVNDSAALAPTLRLAPYPPERARLAGRVSGHAVNPMNQPALSRIPLATLPMAYGEADYRPDTALTQACRQWCPPELAGLIERDLDTLQNQGLERMSRAQHRALRQRYEPLARRGLIQARELIDWLDGGYQFDPACLTD